MSLKEDVRALLETDGRMAELLTGGIYTGVEISRQGMLQTAFDANGELLPSALVKAPATVQSGPYIDAVRTTLQIYFYQRTDTDVIEAAMLRAVSLLNGIKSGPGVWQITFADQVEDAYDLGLNCPLGVLRFAAVRRLQEEVEEGSSGS